MATETRNAVPGVTATLAAMLRAISRDLAGRYQPERHYMRGPGPKCREKRSARRHPAAPNGG